MSSRLPFALACAILCTTPLTAKPGPLLEATLATALPSVLQQASGEGATTDVLTTPADQHDRPTVPVMLNTRGPYRFVIDTGAERTVVSRAVAGALGLAATGQRRLMGIAGSTMVDIVPLDTVALGRREFYGIDAPVLDGADIGAQGIVGLDSLQGQRVLMDFGAGRMAVGDSRALGGDRGFDIVVRARRRSGQLIMTNALVDGVRTDVVIDTGAETSIGNRALQAALSRRHKGMQTELTSVTGQKIMADLDVAKRLKIEGLTLANTLIAYADSPPFERLGLDKRPALFLGMNQLKLFNRIAIDFSSRAVLFDLPVGAGNDLTNANATDWSNRR